MATNFLHLTAVIVLFWAAAALEVTNTSACAAACQGPSLTFATNLTCADDGYTTTSAGEAMKACLLCESTSTADNGDLSTPQNNDVYWFLFNMKYTLEYCLVQSNGSTPSLPRCEAACAGLSPVLLASWFSPAPAKQYEYCSINDTAFVDHADTCASCLQAGTGSVVLGNFLDAMQAACDNQPDATLGETVPLSRALFDTTTIATTASSTSTTKSSPSSPSSSSSSSSSSTAAASSPTATETSNSGLSTGAAAGIGVGCGLAAIIVLGGLAWFVLTRRRQNRQSSGSTSLFGRRKPALDASSPHGKLLSPAEDRTYAQQLAGSEVHEIDTAREPKPLTNELDGRPVN